MVVSGNAVRVSFRPEERERARTPLESAPSETLRGVAWRGVAVWCGVLYLFHEELRRPRFDIGTLFTGLMYVQ